MDAHPPRPAALLFVYEHVLRLSIGPVELPATVVDPSRTHLAAVRRVHEADLGQGFGRIMWPDALDRKYPHRRLVTEAVPACYHPRVNVLRAGSRQAATVPGIWVPRIQNRLRRYVSGHRGSAAGVGVMLAHSDDRVLN